MAILDGIFSQAKRQTERVADDLNSKLDQEMATLLEAQNQALEGYGKRIDELGEGVEDVKGLKGGDSRPGRVIATERREQLADLEGRLVGLDCWSKGLAEPQPEEVAGQGAEQERGAGAPPRRAPSPGRRGRRPSCARCPRRW